MMKSFRRRKVDEKVASDEKERYNRSSLPFLSPLIRKRDGSSVAFRDSALLWKFEYVDNVWFRGDHFFCSLVSGTPPSFVIRCRERVANSEEKLKWIARDSFLASHRRSADRAIIYRNHCPGINSLFCASRILPPPPPMRLCTWQWKMKSVPSRDSEIRRKWGISCRAILPILSVARDMRRIPIDSSRVFHKFKVNSTRKMIDPSTVFRSESCGKLEITKLRSVLAFGKLWNVYYIIDARKISLARKIVSSLKSLVELSLN